MTQRRSNRKPLGGQKSKRQTIKTRTDYTSQTMDRIREVLVEPWDDLKVETLRMLDQGVPIEDILWFIPAITSALPAHISLGDFRASFVGDREDHIKSMRECGRDDLIQLVCGLPEARPNSLVAAAIVQRELISLDVPIHLLIAGLQALDHQILWITDRGVSLYHPPRKRTA